MRAINNRIIVATILAVVALQLASAVSFGQGQPAAPLDAGLTLSGGPPGADALSPPRAKAERNLFSIIKEGGLLMAPLFLCSFITLVFVFERAISLRRGRVIPGPFVKRFMHQLSEGKLGRDEALLLCQESPSAVAEVFAAASRKWGRPAVEVEQAILDALERTGTSLRKYVRLFNAIATLGPLLGLLGTVFGMIRIFHEIAVNDAMGRTELLAGGISEAMLTTATGLGVAVPALCFYVYFVSRVERLTMEIDRTAQELVGEISAEAIQEDRQSKLARANRRGTAA